MAMINTHCPSCGGVMQLENNQLVCPYCHTSVLRIVDAKIDGDVTVMSAEEFAKKIEATKKQFVINIKDDLKVFDVDTMVINKKIKDATAALAKEEFSSVGEILSGVPDTVLSAERLRYLASFEVKNEQELSIYHGYIENARYDRILSLADEQTRATYEKIASFCREQYAVREAMEKEIAKGDELIKVKLYAEAEIYAKEMCRKYPQLMASWLFLCKAKVAKDARGKIVREFEMMQQCYDYMERRIPEEMRRHIAGDIHWEKGAEYYFHETNQWFLKFLVSLASILGEMSIMMLCLGTPLAEKVAFFLPVGIAIGVLVGWSSIFMIVAFVKWILARKEFRYALDVTNEREKYNRRDEYKKRKKNAWLFLSLTIALFAVVAISLILYHNIWKLVLLAVGAVLLGLLSWAVIIWLIVKYIKSKRW